MLDLEGLEDSRDPSEFLGEGERLGVEFVFKNPCMNFLSNGIVLESSMDSSNPFVGLRRFSIFIFSFPISSIFLAVFFGINLNFVNMIVMM